MDEKVNKILNEVNKISERQTKFETEINNLERKLDEIYRELGTKEGREMYRQMDEIHAHIDNFEQVLNEISRTTVAVRKLIEYGDSDIKEIKQALALIYRNTDELEDHFLGEDRTTK
jgi:chromosome segregation ATPase